MKGVTLIVKNHTDHTQEFAVFTILSRLSVAC